MQDLTAAEQRALADLEFALRPGEKSTGEIAAHLGCSRQRVTQIQARAMSKLAKLARLSAAFDRGAFRD